MVIYHGRIKNHQLNKQNITYKASYSLMLICKYYGKMM